MSAATILVTFLGGSAVGAIGAAGVTAWHNSTERLRGRMIAAAEQLLLTTEQARAALWDASVAVHELIEAKDAAVAYAKAAEDEVKEFDRLWVEANEPDEAVPKIYERAMRALHLEIAGGLHNPLDTSRRAEAAVALETAREIVRGLHEYDEDTPLSVIAHVLRETIRNQSRFMTALQGLGDTGQAARSAILQVHGAVGRVTLAFPASGDARSLVAERAEALNDGLIAVQTTTSDAMQAESDPMTDEGVVAATQAANEAQKAFALAANKEISRRRWPWTNA